jgi:hypothetical protein
MSKVQICKDAGSYTIQEGKGYSCLGFDVCLERLEAYLKELGEPAPDFFSLRGTMAGYDAYRSAADRLRVRFEKTGKRAECGLVPQLIGLEGKRVEVVNCWGEKERFEVGRSTGWIPCHIAKARRNSSGVPAVCGAPFKSIRVIS